MTLATLGGRGVAIRAEEARVLWPLELSPHVRGVLVTQILVFLQSSEDDLLQAGWQKGIKLFGRNWIAVENGLHDQHRACPFKGQLPGRHVIKDYSKREQVRATVQWFSPHLLWRHI